MKILEIKQVSASSFVDLQENIIRIVNFILRTIIKIFHVNPFDKQATQKVHKKSN